MGKVIETVADSIAIEILDACTILIGKGNELHLYNRKATKENVFGIEILSIKLTNKIHGIRKFPNSTDRILLIYGEKEFKLLEHNENFQFSQVYTAEISDWISCGLFLNEPKEIVLLTAHSVILRFSYDVDERSCNLKERISCTDKSTLYSSHLFGSKWNELLVFAGNAFGELLIWQPSKIRPNQDEECRKDDTKVSALIHQISAHNGVIFSIDYNRESQCLITTSDDRAIKWWKVVFANSEQNWSVSNLQALSSGYGHVGRVFKGRIICDGPNVYGLSVGEDSYFCLWNQSCELIFKRRQQRGAIIWNFVYNSNNKTIYTIGSTGNLVAFGLNNILKETANAIKATLLPAPTAESSFEYVAKVKFLNEHHLIGITNQNNLMSLRFKSDHWLSWENIAIKVGFKCTVMEVYENTIAICGYKRLMILELKKHSGDLILLQEEELLQSVIRTFVFFTKHHYLACDDRGHCVIFINSVKRYLELPKSKEPWITSVLLLNQGQHIALSNRQGNLLLYVFQKETNDYKLKHVSKHPHGNLGATSLNCVEEMSTSALIWSTGHDGSLKVFSVDFLNNAVQTCTRQIIPVAWIECIKKCNKDMDLFLGFNDNHFVVWCKDYDFLLQLPCGGGHRCWSFALNSTNQNISLVFIKNKRVHFYKMTLLNKELIELPLSKNWHITPCNTIGILPNISSASTHIVISAGDDNLIKIHSFSKQTGLTELKEVHSHISNIRCLKIIPLNISDFLVFSGGGRAQLCVSKVNSSAIHIKELINYTLKTESERKDCKNKSYKYDPETRLMCLDVKLLNKDEYEIYVGCSDGFVKQLRINLVKIEVQLLAQHFYSKCILQIRYLPERDIVIVAATDGFLKIFDSTLSKCLYKLQHHHSGINCLSLLYNISQKSLYILSGGDDQGVSYTELCLEDLSFEVVRQFRMPHQHTSQVCGCALSSNGLYGFTSGVDQMLNKIDLRTGKIVDSFYSCVADIKGVALIDDNLCLMYGCGYQIYAFDS